MSFQDDCDDAPFERYLTEADERAELELPDHHLATTPPGDPLRHRSRLVDEQPPTALQRLSLRLVGVDRAAIEASCKRMWPS